MEFISATCVSIAAYPFVQSLLLAFGFTTGSVTAQVLCLTLVLVVLAINIGIVVIGGGFLLMEKINSILNPSNEVPLEQKPSPMLRKIEEAQEFVYSIPEDKLEAYIVYGKEKLEKSKAGTLDPADNFDVDTFRLQLGAAEIRLVIIQCSKPKSPEKMKALYRQHQKEELEKWLKAHSLASKVQPVLKKQKILPNKPK